MLWVLDFSTQIYILINVTKTIENVGKGEFYIITCMDVVHKNEKPEM